MQKLKAWLSEAYYIDQEISDKLMQINYLRERLTNITASLPAIPGAPIKTNDVFAGAISKIVELEREIGRDVEGLLAARIEISSLIDQLENREYRLVLYKRHVLGRHWDAIAADMGYTRRHMRRIYNEAIRKLYEIQKNLKIFKRCP